MSGVAGSGGTVRLIEEAEAREDGMAQAKLDEVERTALAWFVADRGGDADTASFSAWLASDPRHADAYARIETLWGSAAFAGAAKRARPRNGRTATAAVALALCLVFGSGTALKLTGTAIAWPADHSTAVGEIAAATLDDGTRILLDSGSAVDVAMKGGQREIRVLRGRAFIAVAEDRRPLRVLSGDAVIRDIGTRFAVSRTDDGEHVAVADGLVELREARGDQARTIGPAQASALSGDTLAAVRPINPLETFGWTRHRLYFSNRPLGDVAAELRRYHRGWIVIANDQAATLPISGGLSLDDPAAAMAELARLSGTRLTRVTDRILILR